MPCLPPAASPACCLPPADACTATDPRCRPLPSTPLPQSSRGVSDAQERQQLLAEAGEVAEFLRTQVVQAAVNERGHYEVAIAEEHTGALVEQVTPDMKLPREPKAKPRATQP